MKTTMPEKEIRMTGGARVGCFNTTIPFASLTITADTITLETAFLGKFTFHPQDVVALETHWGLFSRGLRIRHRNPDYNKKVVFWTFSNIKDLIQDIRALGFTEGAKETIPHTVIERQRTGLLEKLPTKPKVSLSLFLGWNIIGLTGFVLSFLQGTLKPLFLAAAIDAGMVAIICGLLLLSRNVRRLLFKNENMGSPLKKWTYFTLFITFWIFIGFIVTLLGAGDLLL